MYLYLFTVMKRKGVKRLKVEKGMEEGELTDCVFYSVCISVCPHGVCFGILLPAPA